MCKSPESESGVFKFRGVSSNTSERSSPSWAEAAEAGESPRKEGKGEETVDVSVMSA